MKMENWNLRVAETDFDKALEVVASLYKLPRAGWVNRGVKNPETVGEHTDSLVELGKAVCKKIPELNEEKFLRMLQIHDWPENITGDIPAISFTDEERKALSTKHELELAAMQKLCAMLGEEGQKNLELWLEFEEGKTLEAQVAMQLDKLQAMMKAKEYEDEGGDHKVTAKEFIDYDRETVKHPVLVEMMEALEK